MNVSRQFLIDSKPFRGRTYIAWFCPEIPISDGPWKLCGLPGLILEAQDEKGEVKFVVERISLQKKVAIENQLLKQKKPVISWQEYKQKNKDEETKRMKYYESKGIKVQGIKTIDIESLDD